MAYNKAKEEWKWRQWKEKEEEKLRACGMEESSIQKLRDSDWEDFRLSGFIKITGQIIQNLLNGEMMSS